MAEMHIETPVKVNAFVDEGIAKLIDALSEVPKLVTLESCQGGNGSDAYVIFRLGGWRDVGSFLYDDLLPKMLPDLRACCSLTLQIYDTDNAQATISVDSSAVEQLVDCLNDVISTTCRVEDGAEAA